MEQLRLLEEDRPRLPMEGECDLVFRESGRAKSLILQMIPPYTLEVVVPRGTRPRTVREFVESNRIWIEKAQLELRSRYPVERTALPNEIVFPSIEARWNVNYLPGGGVKARLKSTTDLIEIATGTGDERKIQELLRWWLLGQARVHLKPWLAREAQRVGAAPSSVQVRTQRTRWGSCSPKENISLNASLLFLEPDLVRYLLVHELCHLHYLDHSRRYWATVEQFEPGYKSLDKRLSDSWSAVPIWALVR